MIKTIAGLAFFIVLIYLMYLFDEKSKAKKKGRQPDREKKSDGGTKSGIEK